MDSGSLPTTSSPKATDNAEVLSRRTPGQGETQEVVQTMLESETSAAEHMGEKIPMENCGGGYVQFGPRPNTVPKTYTAPGFAQKPPSLEGGVPFHR